MLKYLLTLFPKLINSSEVTVFPENVIHYKLVYVWLGRQFVFKTNAVPKKVHH